MESKETQVEGVSPTPSPENTLQAPSSTMQTAEEIMEFLRARMDENKCFKLQTLKTYEIGIPFLIGLVHFGKDVWSRPLSKDIYTHFNIKSFLSQYGLQDKTIAPNPSEINKGQENPYCWMLWTLSWGPGSRSFEKDVALQAVIPDKRGKSCRNYSIRPEFAEAVRRTRIQLPQADVSRIQYEVPPVVEAKVQKKQKKEKKSEEQAA